MLRYTGHPLYDIGVATITAFAKKREPGQVTEQDLDRIADYMAEHYCRNPLKSFLTVAFPNSGFTQPAFEKTPERRKRYAELVLRSFRRDMATLDDVCVFTGEPAVAIAFGESRSLPPGRAFRQHIPLVTGEEIINFHPYGDAGVPVSGKALLAIHAFPLGCAKVGGRLLGVHSDNHELTQHFASSFLERNLRLIQLAEQAGSSRLEETQHTHRTLLVDTLLQAQSLQGEAKENARPFSLTAYHLSNSGQAPQLDIYYLPLQITSFLRDMLQAEYRHEWSAIVERAWETAPAGVRRKKAEDFQPRRNYLYEDLFSLPANAAQFLRTYFLRFALQYARGDQGDPRAHYSLLREADLVSWKATVRFLRRILNMEKERIESIRALADRLADYVNSENDRTFFRHFITEQRYDYFRTALIKANLAHVRHGHPPLITLDPYLEVFEEGDEVARADWRLARDLVLIRMVEQLYHKGWLGKHVDVLPTESEATTNEVTSNT